MALHFAASAAGPMFRTAIGKPLPSTGALRLTGMTAPFVYDGAMNGNVFRAYDERALVPTLAPCRLPRSLQFHRCSGAERSHALRAHLQNLYRGAGAIHSKSDPPDAGTDN